MKKTLMTTMTVVISIMMVGLLSSCSDEDDYDVVKREQTVDLKCQKPDYLKPGDKVALISPSYFTPMENVEKTAQVLRKWGLEPVIGPNVGKVGGWTLCRNGKRARERYSLGTRRSEHQGDYL